MSRYLSTFCFVLLFNFSGLFAQKNINSYKYVIVPEQYEFQKHTDQYQINSLVKFLFNKSGFDVLSTSEIYPEELAKNPCMALKGIVKKEPAFLMTKVKVSLVDCYNNEVFSSIEGKSKLKDYQKAYHEAIRRAFVSVDSLSYKYNGSAIEEEIKVVKISETPMEAEKEVKVAETVVVAPVVVPEKEEVDNKEPKPVKTYSLEGTFFIDMWGKCVISKKGDGFNVVGGDENFEFATISKTSKSNLFMVKKTGFKQTQLLELNSDGNLQIDSNNGVKIYKRIN